MLRFLYLFHRWILTPYHYLVRPLRFGVHCIVPDGSGNVLLVRHTYVSGWYLPGGGLKRWETMENGAKREAFEETGIVASGSLEMFGTYSVISNRYSDHMVLYVIRDWVREERRSFEIAETKFFPLNDLPADLSLFAARRLADFKETENLSS